MIAKMRELLSPIRYAVKMENGEPVLFSRSNPKLFAVVVPLLTLPILLVLVRVCLVNFGVIGLVAFLPIIFIIEVMLVIGISYIGFQFAGFNEMKRGMTFGREEAKPRSLTDDQWQNIIAANMIEGKTNKDNFKVFNYRDSMKINFLFAEDGAKLKKNDTKLAEQEFNNYINNRFSKSSTVK